MDLRTKFDCWSAIRLLAYQGAQRGVCKPMGCAEGAVEQSGWKNLSSTNFSTVCSFCAHDDAHVARNLYSTSPWPGAAALPCLTFHSPPPQRCHRTSPVPDFLMSTCASREPDQANPKQSHDIAHHPPPPPVPAPSLHPSSSSHLLYAMRHSAHPVFVPPTFPSRLSLSPRHHLPPLSPRPRPHPHPSPCIPRAVAVSPDTVSTDTDTSRNPLLSREPTSSHHLLTILWPASLAHTSSIIPSIAALVAAAGGRLSEWRSLSRVAVEARVQLPPPSHVDHLRNALYFHGQHASVDVVLQEEAVAREPKRLAVFDLDSTLIAQETIDELAAQVNLQGPVKEITDRAMNGEIAFRDSLAERVYLLKGLPVHALDAVKDRVQFTPGARELVSALARLGCRTAVVSGGFHFLADHVRDVLGLDYCYANRLEEEEGVLTGRTVGDVVDAEYKENMLKRLAKEMDLRPEQVLAVGDGSNDLLMMRSAGLGVAFNAKPIVQDKAKARLNQPSLRNVLYLLGLADDDIEVLAQRGANGIARSE